MIDWQPKETLVEENVFKLLYIYHYEELQYIEVGFHDGVWWRCQGGIIKDNFIVAWSDIQTPDTDKYNNEEWSCQFPYQKGVRPTMAGESIPAMLPVILKKRKSVLDYKGVLDLLFDGTISVKIAKDLLEVMKETGLKAKKALYSRTLK